MSKYDSYVQTIFMAVYGSACNLLRNKSKLHICSFLVLNFVYQAIGDLAFNFVIPE